MDPRVKFDKDKNPRMNVLINIHLLVLIELKLVP